MHSQISPGLCFIVFTESGIVEIATLHLVVTMHAALLQKGVASSLCTCMHFIKFLLGRTLGNLFRCLLFFHLDMKVWKSLTLYSIFHIIVHF